jgi:peptidoglycan hydrolase CwlO-like protein
MTRSRHLKRLAAFCAGACALIGATQIPASSADLSNQIAGNKATEQTLQQQINAESAQIQKTAGGVAEAKQNLSIIETKLDNSVDQLRNTQSKLMTARGQVLSLERRMQKASLALASNLRSVYENGSPNLVDVILSSDGFTNLLDNVDFVKRAQTEDAQIVSFTKRARAEVLREATRLGTLEEQDRDLTDQILSQRNQQAALEGALLQQQINEQQSRNGKRAKLAQVASATQALQTKLNALEAAAAAKAQESAKQAAVQVNQQVGGLAIDTSGMVQPPAGAPQAVDQMIAAGNAIATLPYIWGGGHGSFISPGYDCSGSVSYVLAAAGLLSSPETSDEFMSYGDPGPGQWVTIYATDGHVWMTIAGWRFDTVALAEDGTRWSQGGGEFGGYVERHPPGL